MINLFTTDSYFNLFPILTNALDNGADGLKTKRIVFCEAKTSLMIERYICEKFGGSFNTEVYSFGKFLHARKKLPKVLSKEGSAMAIKRILSQISLKCFKKSASTLAPSLFNVFMLLKSAKIDVDEVLRATENTQGILKDKLLDVYTAYSAYEKFLLDNGLEDQSSLLSYLPEVISQADDLSNAQIYLVGFSSFTAQMRAIILALMQKANSVTAILTEGDNDSVFVNETARFIRLACEENNFNLLQKRIDGDYSAEGRIVADYIFNPIFPKGLAKKDQDKVYFQPSLNPNEEIERVGELIKSAVLDGECRYKDFTIALDDPETYRDAIAQVFGALNIPYYLDEQVVPLNHPLVTLIFAYVDAFRKGFERESLTEFFKNPLFLEDKALADIFENYVIKYNINYKRIFNPFTYPAKDEEELKKLEKVRLDLVSYFNEFNLEKMLLDIKAEKKLKALAQSLKEIGEIEQAKITEQIYSLISSLLTEMNGLLYGVKLSYTERKNLLVSGVSALKLSILPQRNDAVFIGGFKETALAKAKRLFVIGLTSNVPGVQADVALLSDTDIGKLEEIKVMVEPKIRVVNHRTREKVAMALSAFEDRLYLSYPTSSVDGKKNVQSEVIEFFKKVFEPKPFPERKGYLSKAQGFITFAKECGAFVEGQTQGNFNYDFTIPSSFYKAVGDEQLDGILKGSKKQVKERLSGQNVSLIGEVISPTTIENYYKCPYKAFVSNALKVKEREEGNVDGLSVGNLMHDILNGFVSDINAVKDKETAFELFEKVKERVLKKEAYSKFLDEPSTLATINRVLRECKEYCYKTYLTIDKSQYSVSKTEVIFSNSEKAEYPAIPLNGGKFFIKGKIDRVDEGDNYFRVLDYKTGNADADEKSLFAGVKLQLYLYALAVMGKYSGENEKFPSGLYYLPISDAYVSLDKKQKTMAEGKTLNEEEAISSQDKTFFENGCTDFVNVSIDEKNGGVKNAIDRQTLKNYIDYALKISELATQRLSEGVIMPSPYEKECQYCKYQPLCGFTDTNARKLSSVKEAFNNFKEEN